MNPKQQKFITDSRNSISDEGSFSIVNNNIKNYEMAFMQAIS